MTTETEEPTAEEMEAAEEAAFKAGYEGKEDAPQEDVKDEARDEERPRDEKGRFIAQGKEEESEQEETEQETEQPEPEVAKAEEDPFDKRLRKLEGRLGALNDNVQNVLSSQQELRSALTASAQAKAEGGDAPTQEQVKEALKSGEKMNALKDEFPEWAEAMDEERTRTIEHVRKEMSETMISREDAEKLANERAQEAAREAAAEARKLARLDAKHENWEDEVKLPEFVAWVRQDEELINLAGSDVVSDSIELLDKWKIFKETRLQGENRSAEREAARERNESRLRRSIPPTESRGAGAERGQTEHEAFLAGYNGK